jgi:hypothetical protein
VSTSSFGCVVFRACAPLLLTVGVLPQVNTSETVAEPAVPAAVTCR